jgi:hypothetical protein
MLAPWYAMAYIPLERIAWRHGYALALHGSMGRDLDLIAIPWTEDADSPEKLLRAFRRFIIKKSNIRYPLPTPCHKPHGREAYVLSIGFDSQYIDLSIMPRSEKKS